MPNNLYGYLLDCHTARTVDPALGKIVHDRQNHIVDQRFNGEQRDCCAEQYICLAQVGVNECVEQLCAQIGPPGIGNGCPLRLGVYWYIDTRSFFGLFLEHHDGLTNRYTIFGRELEPFDDFDVAL